MRKTDKVFSFLGVFAGVIGILIVIVAQVFAIIDDSYSFGNIWFLGIFGSIVGMAGALFINKFKKSALYLIILSILLGIISISYLYLVPCIIQLICIIYISNKIIKKFAA